MSGREIYEYFICIQIVEHNLFEKLRGSREKYKYFYVQVGFIYTYLYHTLKQIQYTGIPWFSNYYILCFSFSLT